jgi:hypothetical protein
LEKNAMKNDLSVVTYSEPPFGKKSEPLLVVPGTLLIDTKPQSDDMLVVRIDGGPEFVDPDHWGVIELQAGQTVEWLRYPRGEGKGGLLQLLLVVVALVANVVAPGSGAYVFAFGSFALSVFGGSEAAKRRDTESASNTYSVSIQGNTPRLFQVIPKICGRHQSFPPFAGEPYTEFRSVLRPDGFGGEIEDHDQYFYAVYCLGLGNHEIERVLIDDTDITHFSDVLTAKYLPPGTLPTQALSTVVTAPEVAGQDMLTAYYVGGFAACGPRSIATHISIDIVAPRGVYISDSSGNPQPLNLAWSVEYRYLNEFGTPTSSWEVLGTETRTNVNSLEPRRYTDEYELAVPGRVQIRVVRDDIKSNSGRASHDLQWAALRARLQAEAPLNPHAAHFELVMRASKQLNNISQSRLSIIANGMCRTWHPDTGWSEEVKTRNPAWWLADLWTSTVWGEGLEDSRIDLPKLYELSLVWAQRQDRFDYVFDTSMDADSAAQLIAGSGRARCFRRGGVRTLARDQLQTLPRTAFHRRNTVPGSMRTSEALPSDTRPDGVIAEYFDNRSWSWGLPIECPAPGVTSMSNPVRIRFPGITGRIHCTREGLAMAARLALRRESVQCTTEMEGMLVAFYEAARWLPDTGVLGTSGDVIAKNDLTLTLSEPIEFGAEPLAISIMRDDGSYTDAVEVSPGATDHDVVLPTEPDFTLVTDDGTRERPKFMLFRLTEERENIVKISLIEDGGQDESGAQLLRLSAFVDDERCHTADVHLLPGPGDDQDAIDTTPPVPDIGTKAVVRLPNGYEGFFPPVGPWIQYYIGWTFHPDGTLTERIQNMLYPEYDTTNNYTNAWLIASPLDTIHSTRFEVRGTLTFTYVNPGAPDVTLVGPWGSWQPLDVEQDFHIETPGLGSTPEENGYGQINFYFQIREKATGIIQATSGEYTWVASNYATADSGGGGDGSGTGGEGGS